MKKARYPYEDLDWADFQDLVQHVLLFERADPRWILAASDSRGGPDGGRDALLVGPEGETWVSVKHTTQEGKGAFRAVTKGLEDDVAKAREAGATGFLLVTNWRSNKYAPQLRERLQALHRLGEVWMGPDLDRRVQQHPWIQQYYFGRAQLLVLLPGDSATILKKDTLMAATSLDGNANDRLRRFRDVVPPFVSREDEITAIQHFLDSPSPALLFRGAPGSGKSRLLLEVSLRPWRARERGVLPIHIKPTPGQAIIEGLGRELVLGGKAPRVYILLVDLDDLVLSDQELRGLFEVCDRFPNQVRLLFVGDPERTRNFTKVVNGLGHSLAPGKGLLDLPSLGLEQVRELLRSWKSEAVDLDPIQWFYEWSGGDLGVLLWGLSQNVGLRRRDPSLMSRLTTTTVQRAASALSEAGLEGDPVIRGALAQVALRVPLEVPERSQRHPDQTNPDVEALSRIWGVESSTVYAILDRLEEAGILARLGRTAGLDGGPLRFAPPQVGTLILSERLDRVDGETLLEKWIGPVEAAYLLKSRQLDNLTRAAAIVWRGRPVSVIRRWFERWIEALEGLDGQRQVTMLLQAEKLAPFAPDEASELCARAADQTGAETEQAHLFGSPPRTLAPNSDHVGPVLLNIPLDETESPRLRRALETCEALIRRNRIGDYSNLRGHELLARLFSPAVRPDVSRAIGALRYIDDSLLRRAEEDEAARIVLFDLLKALRMVAVRSTAFHAPVMSFSISWHSFPDSPEALEVRETTCNIVNQLICSPQDELRLAAVHAVEAWPCPTSAILNTHPPLLPRAREEHRALLDALAIRLPDETHVLVGAAIEEVLLEAWMLNWTSSETVGEALRVTEVCSLERALTHAWIGRYPERPTRLVARAPEEKRHAWYIRLWTDEHEDMEARLDERVDREIQSAQAWVDLLARLPDPTPWKRRSGSGVRPVRAIPPNWFRRACRRHPDWCTEIRQETDLWRRLPESFQPYVQRTALIHEPRLVNVVMTQWRVLDQPTRTRGAPALVGTLSELVERQAGNTQDLIGPLFELLDAFGGDDQAHAVLPNLIKVDRDAMKRCIPLVEACARLMRTEGTYTLLEAVLMEWDSIAGVRTWPALDALRRTLVERNEKPVQLESPSPLLSQLVRWLYEHDPEALEAERDRLHGARTRSETTACQDLTTQQAGVWRRLGHLIDGVIRGEVDQTSFMSAARPLLPRTDPLYGDLYPEAPPAVLTLLEELVPPSTENEARAAVFLLSSVRFSRATWPHWKALMIWDREQVAAHHRGRDDEDRLSAVEWFRMSADVLIITPGADEPPDIRERRLTLEKIRRETSEPRWLAREIDDLIERLTKAGEAAKLDHVVMRHER